MADSKENIVMFSFMVQGHLIPFLALALQINQRGYNVIFVNTTLNIIKHRQSIPPTFSICFLEIPFNSFDHGLSPGSENTDVRPYTLVIQLLEASTSLKPTFTSLFSDLIHASFLLLCVVTDIFVD
ncbi:hypothetical protein ACSBR1_008118 [Camellia fascicularis]